MFEIPNLQKNIYIYWCNDPIMQNLVFDNIFVYENKIYISSQLSLNVAFTLTKKKEIQKYT